MADSVAEEAGLEAPPLAAANTNAFKPPRKRLINFGELTRGGRTRISMGRRRPPANRLTPMSIDEDVTLLTVTTPRSPMRQVSPPLFPVASNSSLPPIGVAPPLRKGGPSRSSPPTSRQRAALSPYATAPQGLLPQLQGSQALRSPLSPHPSVRLSPPQGFARQYAEESNAPAQLMVHSSPPAFDTQKGRLGSRSRGERSRGLESSQRLTFDMYRGISSPAKLHAPEQAKRQRAPKAAQVALPSAFAFSARPGAGILGVGVLPSRLPQPGFARMGPLGLPIAVGPSQQLVQVVPLAPIVRGAALGAASSCIFILKTIRRDARPKQKIFVTYTMSF